MKDNAPLPKAHSAMRYGGMKPRQTFGEGRVCAWPDCGTILSTYNRNQTCAVHTLPRPQRTVGNMSGS